MSEMCTHEYKVGSVVTVKTQAKAGCPLCEAEALRERAEKAEARVKELEAERRNGWPTSDEGDTHDRLTRLVDENLGYRPTMPISSLLAALEVELPKLKKAACDAEDSEPAASWLWRLLCESYKAQGRIGTRLGRERKLRRNAEERAEKAEARVVAVEAALGLQADYLALFQTRAEELHEAQSLVRELEAAMKTDAEATVGIGLAVAEYQERAEKAEARVRELEEAIDQHVQSYQFDKERLQSYAKANHPPQSWFDEPDEETAQAIFGAWSTEPWPLALEAKQKVYVVVDDNDNDVDVYETWELAAAHLRAHKGERIEERRRSDEQ